MDSPGDPARDFAAFGGIRPARILDVRYHLLLPDLSMVGSALDYYQWGALLKSMSALEACRRLHRSGIRPIDVVDMVVLDADFPRSLAYCVEGMERALARIGIPEGGHVEDQLGLLRTHLSGTSPKAILEQGLHEYLERFLALLAGVTDALQADYFEAHLAESFKGDAAQAKDSLSVRVRRTGAGAAQADQVPASVVD